MHGWGYVIFIHVCWLQCVESTVEFLFICCQQICHTCDENLVVIGLQLPF